MIGAFSIWWVRVLTMVGIALLSYSMVWYSFDTLDAFDVMTITYAVVIIATVVIENARPNGVALATGLVPTRATPRFMFHGILWAVASLSIIAILGSLLGYRFEASHGVVVIHAFTRIIVLAAGEEVFFRGTIFRSLEERFGPAIANFCTSVSFALLHAGNPGADAMFLLNVFVASVALGITVAATRSLWTSMAFHCTWNVVLAVFFGPVSGYDLGVCQFIFSPPTSGNSWLIAGEFGVEQGALTGIVLAAWCGIMLRLRVFDPYVQAAQFRQRIALDSYHG